MISKDMKTRKICETLVVEKENAALMTRQEAKDTLHDFLTIDLLAF